MNGLEQLQRDWNDLAEIDPMWAICSDPGKAHGKWDTEEFFEKGKYRAGTRTVFSLREWGWLKRRLNIIPKNYRIAHGVFPHSGDRDTTGFPIITGAEAV